MGLNKAVYLVSISTSGLLFGGNLSRLTSEIKTCESVLNLRLAYIDISICRTESVVVQ